MTNDGTPHDASLGEFQLKPHLVGLQLRLYQELRDMPNKMGSVTELAARLRTSRLAVASAGGALERRGLAVLFCSRGDGESVKMLGYRELSNPFLGSYLPKVAPPSHRSADYGAGWVYADWWLSMGGSLEAGSPDGHRAERVDGWRDRLSYAGKSQEQARRNRKSACMLTSGA